MVVDVAERWLAGTGEVRARNSVPEGLPADDLSCQEAEAVLRRLAGVDDLLAEAPRRWQSGPSAVRGEQQASEALARRAAARYQVLVEQIPAITFMADLDGGANEMYVSPQIETILGYSQTEWLEDPVLWYTRLHPEDRDRWHAEFSRTCATGEHFCSEYRFLARDGRVVWVHGEAQMVRDVQGRPLFLQGVAFDVTQQKQAQEALRRSQNELEELVQQRTAELSHAREEKVLAEAASRTKNEFLSRMSHELRTPLNAILGFGQLLDMNPLTNDQREWVEQINRGGKHLLGLINEVLDIARIEAGRMDLCLEPVRVADAFQEVLDLVRPLGAVKPIHFVVDLANAEKHFVLADNQKLKQVLLNLLSNAVKYNRDRGEVRLTSEVVGPSRLRLVVSDTGLGISPEKMPRLFVPFDRMGAEQTGVEGSGLGLPLSKNLIELMGGELTVTSVVGAGSRFCIELARAEASEGPTAPQDKELPNASDGAGSLCTVLYIEDNLDNLRLVQCILAGRPRVHLLTAMQGSLGTELAYRHRPDLILLDVHLPDLEGEQVLRRIKAAPETQSIPVVVLSADATPRQMERLRAAGARDYLTKPISVPRFLELVDEVLQQK